VVVAAGARGSTRPQPVEHARPARLAVRSGLRSEQAGAVEDAEMPSHGVLVQPEPPGELAHVEPVAGCAELLDDPHTALVGKCTADDGRLAHCTKSIGETPERSANSLICAHQCFS
jgi:hypothetical protein